MLLPPFSQAGKFSQLSLDTFFPFLSSAVPPLALAHAAFQARHLWHPAGDVLGTFVEVEENKITFSLPPEGSFINFPMIHPILHINGFRLLVPITAFCRQ